MQSVYKNDKSKCFGCELCKSICPCMAINMEEDEEGFRYPVINQEICVDCKLCLSHCPNNNLLSYKSNTIRTFGGYCNDVNITEASTSGGAFTAIVNSWCDDETYIFGAEANGLDINHIYFNDTKDIGRIQKSKYSQSNINDSYIAVSDLLKKDKKVLFSGTPCQIAALYNYPEIDKYIGTEKLLTVEVVCEGFPSPLLLRKYASLLERRYKSKVIGLDYRYKDRNRWDFQVMHITFANGRTIKKDRWFSPFWIFWSDRLMSRPSCIYCPYRRKERTADITLGDLWGVHIYCPELYNDNRGASLVLCNTEKGVKAFLECEKKMFGHDLDYDEAVKYQRPLRTLVPAHEKRNEFMRDLKELSYIDLVKKYKPHPSLKLFISKYIWGSNKQIVKTWEKKHKK